MGESIKIKLNAIQIALKAPKDQYNSFGKYKYRNAESICEAVKPYLEKYKVALTISDEIVEVGGRVYVKATATLLDCEVSDLVSVTAYAREADDKKGMDAAQVTGATSSYARKYALNGLFLLDDTKDVDSEEYQAQAKSGGKKATPAPTNDSMLPFDLGL
jgi:hypothetical protein